MFLKAFTFAQGAVIKTCIIHRSLSSAAAAFGSGAHSTIYALATGGIRCALAVIRVSGPGSARVLEKIGRFPSARKPEPRKATLRKLYDPVSDRIIDHGIVLWFPGPKSFTGEDSCEFHVHGGPAVITSVLQAIGHVPGCRMAEPGEFSKRAFLNGKMDLTGVEGLGDLISAETEMQRAQALEQMSGSLGSLYNLWRDRIAKCLASAEAFIDFGEDENIESDVLENVEREIVGLLEEMRTHLKDHGRGERLRNGVRVAILGRPNVGKSSLLNILSKRDAAIVSSVPGTTRDVVEACFDLKGYPVVFADTAGIRSSADEIEKEGIRRAVLEAAKADIVLLLMSVADVSKKLIDADACDGRASQTQAHLDKGKLFEEELAQLLLPLENQETSPNFPYNRSELLQKVLVIGNKVDLAVPSPLLQDKLGNVFDACISCKTFTGLETFIALLASKVAKMCTDPKFESPCLTRERYRSHLQNCAHHLQMYLSGDNNQDLALRTHSLKQAMNCIGFITGHLGTEDILDIIFKEFCIGK